jgi:hypothetical protein
MVDVMEEQSLKLKPMTTVGSTQVVDLELTTVQATKLLIELSRF